MLKGMLPCIFNMATVQTISDWLNTGHRYFLLLFIAMFFIVVLIKITALAC